MDEIGGVCFTGVIAHALNADLGDTYICKIIAVGIIDREVRALHKFLAADGNSHFGFLLNPGVECMRYGDNSIDRKVCALLDANIGKVVAVEGGGEI